MASGLLLGAFAIYLTALVSYNSISSDGQVRLSVILYTDYLLSVFAAKKTAVQSCACINSKTSVYS
jgi:hypothetical protein